MVLKDSSSRVMKDMDIFNGTSEPGGPSDFDLIEEIITEERSRAFPGISTPPDLIEEIITEERIRTSLPGPPPPPADLCQPHNQNQRMLQPSSSPPPQPVLVARGTAHQVSGCKNIFGCALTVLCFCASVVIHVVLVYLSLCPTWFLPHLEVSYISKNECWQHLESRCGGKCGGSRL